MAIFNRYLYERELIELMALPTLLLISKDVHNVDFLSDIQNSNQIIAKQHANCKDMRSLSEGIIRHWTTHAGMTALEAKYEYLRLIRSLSVLLYISCLSFNIAL